MKCNIKICSTYLQCLIKFQKRQILRSGRNSRVQAFHYITIVAKTLEGQPQFHIMWSCHWLNKKNLQNFMVQTSLNIYTFSDFFPYFPLLWLLVNYLFFPSPITPTESFKKAIQGDRESSTLTSVWFFIA